MSSLLQILLLALDALVFIVFAHVVMSWLIAFGILNVRQQFVQRIWCALQSLLEPAYSRIRQFLPNLGGIDLSPIILLFAVYALRIVVENNLM